MMKNIINILGLLITLILVSTVDANATNDRGCELSLRELGEAKVNGYNALTGAAYLEQIRLSLRNRGDEPCVGVLQIERTASFDALKGPRNNELGYLIVAPENIRRILLDPISQRTQSLPVFVPAKSSVEIRPRLLVEGGQSARKGRYFATLQALVTLGRNGPVIDREFNVSAQVQSRVQANFVGGRNARLNLGELEPNKQKRIKLQIRATSDVDLNISSENNGNLVKGKGAGEVPYTMSLDGRDIDLENGSQFDVALQNGIRGESLPVVVTVGEFSNAPVGRYQDVVTVTISAR